MHISLKSTLAIFLALVTVSNGLSEPLALSTMSPDKRLELVITHHQSNATGEAAPRLTLRDPKTRKVFDSVPIDTDESDYRKSIGALWSPNSRYLAVNDHLGQLYSYTVYDLADDHLLVLNPLPVPDKFIEEYFTPESTKSRGGEQVNRWIDHETFVATNTIYDVEITYRVTDTHKLRTIDVKHRPQ